MKILDSNRKNFFKKFESLISKRKNKLKSSNVSVANIRNDVRKNGDKALIKYEKKFNKNKIIRPTSRQISQSLSSLNVKCKKSNR